MKIKNTFLLFFCFFMVSTLSKAQFGVRLGLNHANAAISDGDENYDTKRKTGIGAGVFYTINLQDRLDLQPEVNFMQMGFKAENPEDNSEYSIATLNYVHIPVLVKYTFGNLEAIHGYLQAGPYFGYGIGNVKEKYCYDGECETDETEYDTNGEDGPKPVDIGAQFGAGVHLFKNIYVDARYVLGFQNLIGGDNDEGSIKNNSIFLNVAYKF